MSKIISEREVARERQGLTLEQLDHLKGAASRLWESQFSTDPRFPDFEDWFSYFIDQAIREELTAEHRRTPDHR